MNTLVAMLAAAMVVACGALVLLLWALRSGQYEDLEGDSTRILGDEDAPLR